MNAKWDEINAIHKAGYAVVALVLGVPVLTVWMEADGDPFGGCCRAQAQDSKSEVLIKFAGVGAELIFREFRGWSLLFTSSGRGDWLEAQAYLNSIGGNRKALIRDMKSEVTQLLKDNWTSVLAVAQKLREQRCLGFYEVASLVPSCICSKEEAA